MHEHVGFHQAFQYFSSISSNSIFHKKSTKSSQISLFDNSTSKPPATRIESHKEGSDVEQRAENIDEDSKISYDDCTPFTSRSNSIISISSLLDSPTPSPSFSSTTLKVDNIDEPWKLKLSANGDIQQESNGYFLMDRQNMYTTTANSIVER